MGLTLSGDLLLDELNAVGDSTKEFKMIKGLASTLRKISFLGLWDASINQPTLEAADEGSFYNVSVGAESSVVGRCLSGDWIIYLNGNWSVIRVTLQESSSNILIIEPPNNITVKKASTTQDGYLSAVDWTSFNSKQQAIQNAPSVLKFSDMPSSSSSDTILSARAVQSIATGGSVEVYADALWNPTLNKPELRDNAGIPRFKYMVSHDGVIDLGSGSRSFTAKSIISYNSTSQKWETL